MDYALEFCFLVSLLFDSYLQTLSLPFDKCPSWACANSGSQHVPSQSSRRQHLSSHSSFISHYSLASHSTNLLFSTHSQHPRTYHQPSSPAALLKPKTHRKPLSVQSSHQEPSSDLRTTSSILLTAHRYQSSSLLPAYNDAAPSMALLSHSATSLTWANQAISCHNHVVCHL